HVIRIQFFGKIIQLKCDSGRLAEQTFDETDAAPPRLSEKSVMHQGCCDASDENFLRVPVGNIKREVDALGNPLKLEGEQRGNVDSVPRRHQHGSVFALYEADVIPLTTRAVVLCDLHQSQRWILILVAGFNEQDILIRHSEYA